ncbi:MAG: hypothetical protein HEP71_22585 [Roseivirga sp.]|nr:hypothetical protein [Roseivirga sp.]
MIDNLSWKELKALNDLYELQRTSAKIQKHPYIAHLLHDKGLLDHKIGNRNVLVPSIGFNQFYENKLRGRYSYYREFLSTYGIEVDARKNFNEEDLRTLMLIGENRAELSQKLTNLEDFSAKFFTYAGGAKYLKNRKSLKEALYRILDIQQFPNEKKDHQWRLVIDHKDPKSVILCENKSFLKQPWIAKELQVKLWYVGGNNISIINDIDSAELAKPIYYSCDWDLAGLQIYSRIKAILEGKGAKFSLLFPNAINKAMPTDSYLHKSKWSYKKEFSGLPREDFEHNEIKLIEHLIKYDLWIEEESNDLVEMVRTK